MSFRRPESLKRISALMATVFVDMMGFLMVLPLLPFYAERLGASAFTVGVLVGIYALAQVTTAPLWGKLSDRFGRRPVILTGLVVSASAYLVFGLATTVWMLVVSRLIQGAGGGTVGVIQAYVSDAVEPAERAQALGWLTAAASTGVMIGPALGSLAAKLGTAAPGLLAAALCLINLAFSRRWLVEPEGHRERGPAAAKRSVRRTVFEVLRHPLRPVSASIWIYTLGMMAFFAMNGVFALYLSRRFGVTEETIGWFYVYVGAVSVVMRALIVGPCVRWLGERGVVQLGLGSLAAGLLLLPLPSQLLPLGLTILLIPVGTALLFPATTSLVSRLSPQHEAGQVLGVAQSFGGVARLIGPVWAGAAFQGIGYATPFWIAGAVIAATGLFSVFIRRRDAARPASEDRPIEPGTV